MKTMMYFWLCIAAIAIQGCHKEEPRPYTPDTSPTLYAFILPTWNLWTALNSRTTAVIQSGTFNLTGIAVDSNMISITISGPLEDSISYDLGYGSGNTGVYSQGTNIGIPAWSTNGDPACTGSFKLTKLDTVNKLIYGSFEFYAFRITDSSFRNITDGAFRNIKYTTQ
jgi:Family of unknown function (DUF6252)